MILTNTLCLIIVGAIALFNGEMKLLKKQPLVSQQYRSRWMMSIQGSSPGSKLTWRLTSFQGSDINADLVSNDVPRG